MYRIIVFLTIIFVITSCNKAVEVVLNTESQSDTVKVKLAKHQLDTLYNKLVTTFHK